MQLPKLAAYIAAYILVALLSSLWTISSQATNSLEIVLDISGSYTTQDSAKRQFNAFGNAMAYIEGQKAAVEADEIHYDDKLGLMDCRGHVRILRNGMLSTGANYKFRIRSHEYLITESNEDANARPVTVKFSERVITTDTQKHREDNPDLNQSEH